MVSHETPRSLEKDGHRTVLRRTDETVVLYARSGRVVTQHWMDLAVAGMELRPGTVLDGEAVIWRDGRLNFAAAQARAASSVTRARALAARYPASYVCWDVLQHPDPAIGDCRSRPYTERSAFLLQLLSDVGPPIQAVPASDDRDVAMLWYDTLREQGIEGIVCKRGGAGYPSGRRGWAKVRHTDTADALVVGFTGPPQEAVSSLVCHGWARGRPTRPRPLLPSPRALRTVTDVGRSGRRRPPPDCCASRSTCRPAATRRRRASHCCP
ncbi:DNA ligase [Streptomyces sp. NBC_00378]|uniref:ATP-dependent DNA ligase n=1 Tax=unclassified Streptomyces TaxID=2593676 RepID=UPI00338E32B9